MKKLTVETPYGIATRKTDRDYQFVVVSDHQSESYLRARHEAAADYSIKLAARYRATAARGGETPFPGYTQTPEQFIQWAAEAEAAAARPFVMPAPGFVVHGWSGSATGAGKMAADASAHGHLGVLVVPVAPVAVRA